MDVIKEESSEVVTECTKGFDPLSGVSTAGCKGTEDVHCIGCGLATTWVATDTEEDKLGCISSAAIESFHTRNFDNSVIKTVESANVGKSIGTSDTCDDSLVCIG